MTPHCPSLCPMSFHVGQRVRVVGLLQSQQHNDKAGTVSSAIDQM